MDGEMQGAAQIGMADQDQGGEGLAVHLVAEQQAQLFQHRLGEQVGLVNDHERHAALGVEQVGEGFAHAGDHARLAEGRLVAEAQHKSR